MQTNNKTKKKKKNLENPKAQQKRKTPVNFTDITWELQKTAKSSRPDERFFYKLKKKKIKSSGRSRPSTALVREGTQKRRKRKSNGEDCKAHTEETPKDRSSDGGQKKNVKIRERREKGDGAFWPPTTGRRLKVQLVDR